MATIKINTFTELITLCSKPNVSKMEMNTLLTHFLKAFFVDYDNLTKEQMIEASKEYWAKWGKHPHERPLFIDSPDLSVID
jgi:hypothetical protein